MGLGILTELEFSAKTSEACAAFFLSNTLSLHRREKRGGIDCNRRHIEQRGFEGGALRKASMKRGESQMRSKKALRVCNGSETQSRTDNVIGDGRRKEIA